MNWASLISTKWDHVDEPFLKVRRWKNCPASGGIRTHDHMTKVPGLGPSHQVVSKTSHTSSAEDLGLNPSSMIFFEKQFLFKSASGMPKGAIEI